MLNNIVKVVYLRHDLHASLWFVERLQVACGWSAVSECFHCSSKLAILTGAVEAAQRIRR